MWVDRGLEYKKASEKIQKLFEKKVNRECVVYEKTTSYILKRQP